MGVFFRESVHPEKRAAKAFPIKKDRPDTEAVSARRAINAYSAEIAAIVM